MRIAKVRAVPAVLKGLITRGLRVVSELAAARGCSILHTLGNALPRWNGFCQLVGAGDVGVATREDLAKRGGLGR
jgi:hypothetical protein